MTPSPRPLEVTSRPGAVCLRQLHQAGLALGIAQQRMGKAPVRILVGDFQHDIAKAASTESTCTMLTTPARSAASSRSSFDCRW